ncbi:cholinesterase [Xylariales sp. PMI_506]|nr:cholinesterase [Xylariales sp. PMI_506]
MQLFSIFQASGQILALFLVSGTRAKPSTIPRTTSDCVVETPNGRIIGHFSTSHPDVCEFLGIPYAAAPVGELRFAEPKAQSLSGDFTADTWGADCPQNPSSIFAYPNATAQYDKVFASFVSTTATNNTQSEDCLKINIWIKADLLGSEKSPVLMWIHGGRHNSGTSHTTFYDGSSFAAAEDAFFVTFNFRMNIFGFPGSPETTQNVGLLDHYTAVEWVHDNIQYFGGENTSISLFGQSSGAAAVANWAYTFKEKPLVAGLASHSGNQFSFPPNSMDLASANWYNVTGTLGCGSSGATLECMRSPNITFQQILAAMKLVPTVATSSVARSQPQFQVTIDNKTWWTDAEYVSRARAGDLARVPYLQIHNDHESGFYRISAAAQGHILAESDWLAFEQETFTCASAAEAYYRSQQGIPTYRFRNMADWDNTRLYEDPSSGAYHGVEIYMITGNSELVSGIAPEDAESQIIPTMQAAWYQFAADAAGGLPSALEWPVYVPGEDTLGEIALNNTAVVSFIDSGTYDSACPGLSLDFWNDTIPV